MIFGGSLLGKKFLDKALDAGVLGFGIMEKVNAPEAQNIPALGLQNGLALNVPVSRPGSLMVRSAIQLDATNVAVFVAGMLDPKIDTPTAYTNPGIHFITVRLQAIMQPFCPRRGVVLL